MSMNTDSQEKSTLEQWQNPAFLIEIRQQMLKFAILQLSSFQLAEDAVQEALTSALQHRASFKGHAAFKTWVFAILKNKIIDLLRQNTRVMTMSELFSEEQSELSIDRLFDAAGHWHKSYAPVTWPNPEKMMEQQDFWLIFNACLNHLPAKYAQVFMLREMIELSAEEICQMFGISVNHLNVLMYRSRTKLRECLENKGLLQENCSC